MPVAHVFVAHAGCAHDAIPAVTIGGATIVYEFTSLGPPGDTYLEGFTAQWYEKFMHVWEEQMSHYLETGELIPTADLQSG